MKARLADILILSLCLCAPLGAQEYEVPVIEHSKDKVRVDGKSFYAHVVTAKQTLWSISKAYGVSVQDIYDANRNLDLEHAGLKAGQVIFIPVSPAPATVEAAQPVQETIVPAAPDETMTSPSDTLKNPADSAAAFVYDMPEVIRVAVILPFGNSRLSDTSVDFYSGMLLAARDLGNSGVKLELITLDTENTALTDLFQMMHSDVIIGPITDAGIEASLNRCPGGKYMVSPLDPKTAERTRTERIIQAPTPSSSQNGEVVRWLAEDMQPADSLIVLLSSDSQPSANARNILDSLNAAGLRYRTIKYGILEGLEIQNKFTARASVHGTTRYIIASEDESFVNDAVRNINLMAYKKYDVALYASSKIRSYNTIETENLHNVNTHMTAAYYTDYTSEAVKSFVLAYRALFEAEPNSFALHGYDTLHYFVNICARYGRNWPVKLCEYSESGLQTSFRFVPGNDTGKTNAAVRRVLFTPDYKVVLL